MKKSILAVAGVAAVAGITMPVAGAFATIDFTDTLNVTINNTCSLTRGTTAHGSETWNPTATTSDTLTKTVNAGELNSAIGTSNFKVICNNHEGWKVTATATALTGKTTTSENIPLLESPAAGTAGWNAVSTTSESAGVSADATVSSTTATEVATGSTTTGASGKTFTMTYNVSTDTTLSDQAYEGKIEYTFAQLNS